MCAQPPDGNGSPVALEPVAVEDAGEQVPLDELPLLARRLAEAAVGEPVEVGKLHGELITARIAAAKSALATRITQKAPALAEAVRDVVALAAVDGGGVSPLTTIRLNLSHQAEA